MVLWGWVFVPSFLAVSLYDDPMTGEAGFPTVGRSPKRRQEILAATRALFDESGSRYAQVDDVARAVGISRAIIYRHFSSKEELFAEVLVTYLRELKVSFSQAAALGGSAEQRLENLTDAILDFGLAHPAFVDCALTLVRLGPSVAA